MKRRSPLRLQKGLTERGLNSGAAAVIAGGVSNIGLILLALFLLALSIFLPQKISGIRMHATDVIAPALQTATKPITDLANVVRNVSGLAELQAENIRLQQENMKLREWYQTALLLEAENKSLRNLLNVKVEPQYTTITARVISDSGSAFAKSLIVSAGSDDGVEKGQAVLSSEGLIGRVIEVGRNTARVLMITDINSRVPVLIEDTRQHAILAGHNQSTAKLVHLPPDTSVKVGARIITSGHGGMFPPGLVIGKAKEAKSKDNIIIQPFADFSRIVHVRIVNAKTDSTLVPVNKAPVN